jgi:hypothetical protein
MTIVVAAVAVLGLPMPQTVRAAETGTILGVVFDDYYGEPVPGATVKVTHQDTALARTATTDDEGRFSFPGLPTGKYAIRAWIRYRGLRPDEVVNVPLTTGDVLYFYPALHAGPAFGDPITANWDNGYTRSKPPAAADRKSDDGEQESGQEAPGDSGGQP